MYPQYHPYLMAVAAPATTVSPQTMRYLGWAILIGAILVLLNKLFGKASD